MSEIQKISPQPLQQDVIQFDSPIPDNQPGIGDLILPVFRRWPIIIVTFLLVCAVAIPPIWMLFQGRYETAGAIRVSPIIPRIIFNDSDSERPMPNYDNFKNTEAGRIANDVVLNRVADKLKNRNLDFFRDEPDPVMTLRKAIRDGKIIIDPGKRTELIDLRMTSQNRSDAEMIIDAFLDSYLEVVTFDEARGGNETIRILEDQRKALSDKMDRQRETIAQLIGEYGTQELTPRQDMMLQQVDSLQRELINVNIRRISLETRIKMQESLPSDGDSITPEMQERRNTIVNTDPGIQALMGEVRRYESLVAEAEQNLKESNPEMQRRKAMLVNLNERLDQRRKQVTDEFDKTYQGQTARNRNRQLAEVKAELAQTIEYEQQIAAKMEQMDTKTIDVGRKQFAINDQQEQLTRTKETYNEICKRIEEIEVESKRPARISIAFRASSIPADGRRDKLIVASVFGGLVLGVFFAFLLAKADKSLHHPDEIVHRVGVRIIGTTTSPRDVDRKVLSQHLNDDYQTIRANLGLLNGDGHSRIIAVTSAGTGDGKTTFSVNLAISFAQSGEKILLIDGDLRKPDIADTLQLPKGTRGLQEVLFGKRFEDAVYVTSSGLHVLAADIRNAGDALDLLNHPRTVEIIRRIAAGYDHVIIDTPPVLAFSDALLWAKIADATILTSFVDHTSQVDLREAIERLEQVEARIIGTVVNNVRAGHSYHRYGYGYGYGYGEQANRRTPRKQRERLLLASTPAEFGK